MKDVTDERSFDHHHHHHHQEQEQASHKEKVLETEENHVQRVGNSGRDRSSGDDVDGEGPIVVSSCRDNGKEHQASDNGTGEKGDVGDDEEGEHELLSTTFDVDIVDDDVPLLQVNRGRKNHSQSLIQPSKPDKDLIWDDDAIINCFQLTVSSHDVQSFDEDNNSNKSDDDDDDGLDADVDGSPERQRQTKRCRRRHTTTTTTTKASGPSCTSNHRSYWKAPPPFLNHQYHHDHHQNLVVTPAFPSTPSQRLFTVQESKKIISIFKNHPIPTKTTTTTARPLLSRHNTQMNGTDSLPGLTDVALRDR